MTNIYVASSWRNQYQDIVVKTLRFEKHHVYDFKHPDNYDEGFHWSTVDGGWKTWSTKQYIDCLNHPSANTGFKKDFNAMAWADACVLVLPCGRSAHLEAGYMIGQKKKTVIYIPSPEKIEPELMYKMADLITDEIHQLLRFFI